MYSMEKSQCNKDGYWEDYWLNGKVRKRYYYSDGLLNGLYERFHDNGQLHYKGKFINNEYVGFWERYYPDGKIHRIVYYIR
jgi:antitoxin component YwqK of YwqJK toxin-antitoxin module